MEGLIVTPDGRSAFSPETDREKDGQTRYRQQKDRQTDKDRRTDRKGTDRQKDRHGRACMAFRGL